MSELTEPNRVSVLESRVTNLEGDLRDCRDRILALERRFDHDDAIRGQLRELTAKTSKDEH